MKKLNIFLFLLLSISISLYTQPLNVKVNASQAVLYNPDNEAILFNKRGNDPCYPASIIKIATALFVLEKKKIALHTPFKTSQEAVRKINAPLKHADPMKYTAHILEHDGRNLGLIPGEVHSLGTLLHALLIPSANDVANVIAENSSGSIDLFIQELNSYLKERGFSQTQVQNPHGLYHPAQLSTAYEIAKMTALALQNETFEQIIKTTSFSIQRSKKGTVTPLRTTNRLLKPGPFYYPKAIGGKTGYFSKAGYNLVAIAEEGDRRLIAAVFGCKKPEERYQDVIHLFESAFKEKKVDRLLFSQESEQFSLSLPKAKSSLKASLDKDLVISYYPSEEPKGLQAHLKWEPPCLPIEAGAKVGELVVETKEHRQVAIAPLYAKESVSLSWQHACRAWIDDHQKMLANLLILSLGFALLFRFFFTPARAK